MFRCVRVHIHKSGVGAVIYEDSDLPIEPQGHGLAAINKKPWLSGVKY